MKGYLKGTNIEVQILHFITVSNGKVPCQMCECRVPAYGNSKEVILADMIEIGK